MQEQKKICFLGAGNMARSIIIGLCEDAYPTNKIWATNPSYDKLETLYQNWGINVSQNNITGVQNADVIVLCVKPHIVPQVLREVRDTWQQHKPLIISVAAGLRESAIRHALGSEGQQAAVVRCMPNTPCIVGSGTTGLYGNAYIKQADRDVAETIMRSVSIVQWLENETDLDKLTALSGSGPGYVFYMMEAMANKAIDLGLPPDNVELFTAQTFLGAARMALESNQSFEQMKKAVCSRGGTTQQAIQHMDNKGVNQILGEAMQASYDRAREIGDSLSDQEEQT